MTTKNARLLLAGLLVMWIGLAVMLYFEGSLRLQIGYVLATAAGLGVGLQIWLRQRRFDRDSVSGFAEIHDSVAFDSGDYGLIQVALRLQLHGVGAAAGQRIYRVFRLPGKDRDRFAAGERIPVRVRSGDLDVIQISLPAAEGAKPRYVEARASQTPLEQHA